MPEPDLISEPGDGTIELAPRVRVPISVVRLQYSRSGGPGGQNVNKVNTKAELWISLASLTAIGADATGRLRNLAGRRLTRAGEIHITSETERSQDTNRAACFERLRALLVEAMVVPKARKKTKPSKNAKRKRVESKRRRSEVKSGRQFRGSGE